MNPESLIPDPQFAVRQHHRNLNKGHHFEFQVPAHQAQFAVMIHQALNNPWQRPRNGPNYRGLKFGRLEVVAFSHGGHWVVRCQCGNHEMRNSKRIKVRSPLAMCQECRRVADLRGDNMKTPLKELKGQ